MAKTLAIDLGTSCFKFALFDGAGQLCGLARRAPPCDVPRRDAWNCRPMISNG